ncbi:MarR family winged helix-turn-helix transcriptional regulator [Streptomyces sp. NBC_01750]|uniref:MarR family winged helix-turn-helix transcriptional regulator n=1 Tax=Streptomyces sp. NBC_01750 TaxID=2975928 RepID=UPI002DDACABE|nr:MarR family transcriptional regulator [Streptomyces sp. NBC_01750]WSD33239.1 MarR family transcriptional regulator [Streptomyces sp. NBC_01750]
MRNVAQQLRSLQQSFDAFDEAAATRLGLNRTDLRCLDLVLGAGQRAGVEWSGGEGPGGEGPGGEGPGGEGPGGEGPGGEGPGGELSAGELSAALKLSPAATTTVIDRLERVGLVTRSRDAANRRRVLVAATDAARAAEAEVYLPVGVAGAEALSRYDEDQLATILDFLQAARQVQEGQVARLGADGG